MFKADNTTNNTVDLGGTKEVDLEKVNNKPIDNEPDLDLDEFFAGMDKKFNGAIFENEELGTQSLDTGNPQIEDSKVVGTSNQSGEVAKLKEELNNLKQRYDGSSREAIRLAEENKKLERYSDYLPIMDTMREDPGLINHVRSYLEGNVAPKSIKEELNLPEDFFFDGDEAVKDPSSNSAKVFQTMIDKGVKRQLAEHNKLTSEQDKIRNAETQRERDFQVFRQENEMSDDEFNTFLEYAQSTKLTLKDIHYLMNRKNREKGIAQKAIDEQNKKLQEMRGQPRSVASAGSVSDPLSEERMVFDAIKNAGSAANIFGEK